MKLEEAWLKIMEMEESERFKPNQIHSILADFGIFKTNPMIKLVLKSALEYKLWEIVCAETVSIHKLGLLRYKLEQDGFSSVCIDQVLNSILSPQSKSDFLNIDNEKDIDKSSHTSSDFIHSNLGGSDTSCEKMDRLGNVLADAKERLALYKNLDNCSTLLENLKNAELHLDVKSPPMFQTSSTTKGNIGLLVLFGVFLLIWLGFCLYCFIFKWTNMQWYDYIWGSLLAILGIIPVCGLPWYIIFLVCKQLDIVDDF